MRDIVLKLKAVLTTASTVNPNGLCGFNSINFRSR